MPLTFVDTSAAFALIDADDEEHGAAEALWARLLFTEEPLITSNYVVTETISLLQRRMGMFAVRAYVDQILPLTSIHWLSPEEHHQATEAFLTANRRKLSFVDCSSFVVMRRLGIRQAFHFDGHFDEHGFEPA